MTFIAFIRKSSMVISDRRAAILQRKSKINRPGMNEYNVLCDPRKSFASRQSIFVFMIDNVNFILR